MLLIFFSIQSLFRFVQWWSSAILDLKSESNLDSFKVHRIDFHSNFSFHSAQKFFNSNKSIYCLWPQFCSICSIYSFLIFIIIIKMQIKNIPVKIWNLKIMSVYKVGYNIDFYFKKLYIMYIKTRLIISAYWGYWGYNERKGRGQIHSNYSTYCTDNYKIDEFWTNVHDTENDSDFRIDRVTRNSRMSLYALNMNSTLFITTLFIQLIRNVIRFVHILWNNNNYYYFWRIFQVKCYKTRFRA